MTKIIDHLSKSDDTIFSFEILPPVKGESFESLVRNIEPLTEIGPKFIDVTYHREEYVYDHHENGLLQKKTIRKRPGTVGICAALMQKFQVDTVPHIICGGFSKEETENALIDLNFLGIDNVLALRGDPIKSQKNFTPHSEGHAYASELLEQIVAMNNGRYLDPKLENPYPTNFCVGVAGYPEKHHEAPNIMTDLHFLKQKVDLGAEFIVTQMFFDNQKYFDFVKLCRDNNINVPIIPGIKPLTTKKQLSVLPSFFHIDIPEDLAKAVLDCKDNNAVAEIGVEWAINQCKELMKEKVPCLHFYTMSKSKQTYKIASSVF